MSFFVRGGINNFQKALDDADSTNTKKYGFTSRVWEQDLKYPMCRSIMRLRIWLTSRTLYIPMYFL